MNRKFENILAGLKKGRDVVGKEPTSGDVDHAEVKISLQCEKCYCNCNVEVSGYDLDNSDAREMIAEEARDNGWLVFGDAQTLLLCDDCAVKYMKEGARDILMRPILMGLLRDTSAGELITALEAQLDDRLQGMDSEELNTVLKRGGSSSGIDLPAEDIARALVVALMGEDNENT